MKSTLTIILILFSISALTTKGDVTHEEEPPIVNAIVRELIHNPNSSPPEEIAVPGKQPPTWMVKLEVIDVLRGDLNIKGKMISTSTADMLPDGNGRFVTPKLHEGDSGIFAIKKAADGSWIEVYAPYEIEKGIRLPLIKGRHRAYDEIISRFAGETLPPASHPNVDQGTSETSPVIHPTSSAEPTRPGTILHSIPSSAKPWNLVVSLIAAGFGLFWLILKQRS